MNNILAIIAALGGTEGIKYLFNRKARQRIETAEAVSQEVTNLTTTLETISLAYENELKRRDEREDTINRLHTENTDKDRTILELTTLSSRKDLTIERLSFFKCEVRGCTNRQPPNKEF